MITRTNLNNIKETGRLGNQIWAIASTIGIAMKHDVPFYFPNWNYERFFKYPLPTSPEVYGTNKLRIFRERTPYYDDINLPTNYDWDLKGYFQVYKYFYDYMPILWRYLEPNYKIEENYKGKVAVHVRRGDYLNLEHIHPVLPKSYYTKSMSKMKSLLKKNTEFVFFSDDLDWCKENFSGEDVLFHETTKDILDFFAMRTCSHFIIANSSFSYWAACLEEVKGTKIIAPKTWVKDENKDDRVPEYWVRI